MASVTRGVPFREAHEISGMCAVLPRQAGNPADLSDEELASASPDLGPEVAWLSRLRDQWAHAWGVVVPHPRGSPSRLGRQRAPWLTLRRCYLLPAWVTLPAPSRYTVTAPISRIREEGQLS